MRYYCSTKLPTVAEQLSLFGHVHILVDHVTRSIISSQEKVITSIAALLARESKGRRLKLSMVTLLPMTLSWSQTSSINMTQTDKK